MLRDPLIYNERYYREAEVFKHNYWTAGDQRRLEMICEMLPTGVTSILDIGSGRGLIVKAMRDRGFRVIATDYSHTALSLYDGERVCCSCGQLPFRDGSFDIVACTEVLEHLDDRLYAAAVLEIARVARRYALISVPHKEQLVQSMMKCYECGERYTMYGHVRTFLCHDMLSLLPGFKVICTRLGDWVIDYNPWLLWFRQHVGRTWAYWKLAMCPKCGARARPPGIRNPITLACDFLNNRIPWRPRRRNPLYTLYENLRQEDPGRVTELLREQCGGTDDKSAHAPL
ncbi:MAG TPA: class I SAM-dependent methyltransferase [Phycisphaerae bacterium]|nr:class I SAM-dependent methyltransferase [Phycisphaerae bacterium]